MKLKTFFLFMMALLILISMIVHLTGGLGTEAIDLNWFIAHAKNSPCSEWDNRLYLIDRKFVFWIRSGNCPDASFSHTLYRLKDKKIICRSGDSIAGPREIIEDKRFEDLCKAILYNTSKPRLGLGEGHTVENIPIE